MQNLPPIGRIVTFTKCSCCSNCYFFFADNGRCMAALPMYSKAEAFSLLESCKFEGGIAEQDYQFFGREIASSQLPEAVPALGPSQQHQHFRKPEILKSILEAVSVLSIEARGEQSAQRPTPFSAQD